MRTRRIEHEHMQLTELKKQKLVQKYESKSFVLSALEQERRAFSTLKRDDNAERLLTVRSRGDLHEKSRQSNVQSKLSDKDQKIEQFVQQKSRDGLRA